MYGIVSPAAGNKMSDGRCHAVMLEHVVLWMVEHKSGGRAAAERNGCLLDHQLRESEGHRQKKKMVTIASKGGGYTEGCRLMGWELP